MGKPAEIPLCGRSQICSQMELWKIFRLTGFFERFWWVNTLTIFFKSYTVRSWGSVCFPYLCLQQHCLTPSRIPFPGKILFFFFSFGKPLFIYRVLKIEVLVPLIACVWRKGSFPAGRGRGRGRGAHALLPGGPPGTWPEAAVNHPVSAAARCPFSRSGGPRTGATMTSSVWPVPGARAVGRCHAMPKAVSEWISHQKKQGRKSGGSRWAEF